MSPLVADMIRATVGAVAFWTVALVARRAWVDRGQPCTPPRMTSLTYVAAVLMLAWWALGNLGRDRAQVALIPTLAVIVLCLVAALRAPPRGRRHAGR